MKTTIAIALLSFVMSFAQASPQTGRGPKSEILSMTFEINQAVRNDELTNDQLENVREGLEATLESMNGARKSSVICAKSNNGLYYPTNAKTGSVIGSTSGNAGHLEFEDCKATLPKRGADLACYKQANGMYYPSNPLTGDIVGSSSGNAGYLDLSSCLKVIKN